MASKQAFDPAALAVLLRRNGDPAADIDYTRVIITSVVGYVVLQVLQMLFTGLTSPIRHLPGPTWSKFTRLPLKKAIVGGRRIFYIDDLHKKYGNVVRIAPDEISVADVEGFKQIHAHNAKYNKSDFYEKLTIFPRHSCFTMQTKETHAARRRLMAKGFSKSYSRDHYEPIIAAKARLAVKGIKERALKGNVDLMQWWTFQVTDTVGALGFGESFGMLEKGEKTDYILTLEAALVGNGIGAEVPIVRTIGGLIPTKKTKQLFKATNYILEYGQRAVDNAKTQDSKVNLMASVLQEGEKENSTLDDLDVCVEATALIFAGSHTASNTLTYFMWCVLKDPALTKKIEEEADSLPEGFKDVDMEQLTWLNATLHEVMRLYAAVPGSLTRYVPKGGVTISGHFIPEGSQVGTQAYTMHRKEDLWPNPYEFKPERWLPGVEMSPDAKATYCAWGAGAYSCIGIHIAYMEMRYGIVEFFRQCKGAKLAPTVTDESMDMENYFVISPKGHKCEITLR